MKGWFTEMNDLWAGQAMSLEVDEILHHEKSRYQDILVFNRYVSVCGAHNICMYMHVCVGWIQHYKEKSFYNHLPFPSHLLSCALSCPRC